MERDQDRPPKQQHGTLLPVPPIISTTISSLLHNYSTTSNEQTNATPLTSYLPATPPMASWFRKSAIKPHSPTNSRDPSPSKSVVFSERSSLDERRSQETTTTERGRKSKRSSRPKTSYSICYAPPRSNKKIKVRARPLLQLHKIESRARPRPELEVLPPAIFSARLNKAIVRFSPSKRTIAPSDLAIVRADKYHDHDTDADDSTDILAILSGVSRRASAEKQAKLYLQGDVVWDAYRLSNGSYQCATTDTHGLTRTVRWVAKKDKTPDADDGLKRFNFSTITPGSRRHPVIASLDSNGLDVSDIYSVPASISSPRSDSPADPEFLRTDSGLTLASTEANTLTSDELRTIIRTTAIFVALCEGWCTGYGGADDTLSRSPSSRSCTALNRPPSLDGESLRRHGSLRQALRSPSFFRPGMHDSRPASPASSLALDDKVIPPIPESGVPALDVSPRRRARANTVGTVIVGSPTRWRPTFDDETEDEAEDIKEEEEPIPSRPAMGSEDSGAPTLVEIEEEVQARNVAAKERKIARPNAGVAAKTEQPSIAAEKPKNKKKKTKWSKRLLCGMA